MKITEETIPFIEKALGFKLHEWQQNYLLDEPCEISTGRAVGRTVTYIVKLLLINKQPIDLDRDARRYQDHGASTYTHRFKGEVRYINDKLTSVGLATQLLTKNKPKPNQSLSIAVDVNTDKLQHKLRAIAKHAEALANELDVIDNEDDLLPIRFEGSE